MHELLIQINNISKRFPGDSFAALDSISASVPAGKIIGVVGPDGAGKTTLLRLMAGLFAPSDGEILIAGYNTVTQANEIHKIIGYMPQKFGLYEDLTVQKNLNLYADLQGVDGEERAETFKKLLAFTDLSRFTDRFVSDLSGGMKQKLGLACALIRKPTLLLLDEPSVGVDPISRRELWKMVNVLLPEGISVVWSTAYLDEAERCDRILLLSNGKLLYDGEPTKFAQQVGGRTFKISQITGSHREVLAHALNQKNVMDGVIQGSDVRIVIKSKTLSDDDKLQLLKADSEIIQPTPPRFEDAFVDILGGGPGGNSLLAQNTPQLSMTREVVVEARGLTKQFGSFTAADQITFSVKRGEIFGLLGPNGAGKSTTFKMMCGLLKPTEGRAFIKGFDLQKSSGEARSHIGYMAQKFSLYGNLSVRQNLMFFAGAYNLFGQQRRQAVDQMVEIFNFKEYLDDSAGSLPLGFKQRLALSCAVMHRPEILFLDEPTSGVDPIARREFWNHMNGLVEKGVTIIVTTHFMDEAEYCDRIALVYRSKIVLMDTPDTLKKQAQTAENRTPTLEDAFIKLIERYEAINNNSH